MLGKLEESQIDDLLKSQFIGRIGCHADGVTYVVPVNYVYADNQIFAHSGMGMKIDMLRTNPDVCFQIDTITDIHNWQSVIVWGKYEEISDIDEQQKAMQLLNNRIAPLLASSGHPSHGITENVSDIGFGMDLVLYKIVIAKKTGRFEKS